MKSNRYPFTPPRPRDRLIAHRGISGRAPENTMASFALVAKEGFDWIEFDVQLTNDNSLVIFHDDTLERTSNGTGFVYQKTLEYLSSLDAGSWFSPTFKNERIPSFLSIVPFLLKLKLFLNIELKLPENPPPQHIPLFSLVFSQTMLALWPVDSPKPLISSFHWPLLESIRSHLISFPIGYLSETCSFELIDKISLLHNTSLHCPAHILTPDYLKYAQHRNVPVLVYDVKDPQEASHLLTQGVFALFVEDPSHMSKELLSLL